MNIPSVMTVSEQMADMAEYQNLTGNHYLAWLLVSLAIKVKQMERALDEIVEEARQDEIIRTKGIAQ